MRIEFADGVILNSQELRNVELDFEISNLSEMVLVLCKKNEAYKSIFKEKNISNLAFVLNGEFVANIDEAKFKISDELYIFIPLSGG